MAVNLEKIVFVKSTPEGLKGLEPIDLKEHKNEWYYSWKLLRLLYRVSLVFRKPNIRDPRFYAYLTLNEQIKHIEKYYAKCNKCNHIRSK